MYLTAASAAWRYSGKVTGPDSRLSRPSVIGVPVACFSVPSAAARSGVAAAAGGVLPAFVADELSSLEPRPATSAPVAAMATKGAHFFVTFTSSLLDSYVAS